MAMGEEPVAGASSGEIFSAGTSGGAGADAGDCAGVCAGMAGAAGGEDCAWGAFWAWSAATRTKTGCRDKQTERLSQTPSVGVRLGCCSRCHGATLQEVADHLMAALGEHALGMELHALYRQTAMPQPHDDRADPFVSLRPRRDGQLGGQRVLVHDERVVAGASQRRRQSAKNAFAVMLHSAGLAVHERARAHHFAAERLANGLVSQANPKNRRFSRHVADQRHQNSRFARRARPRRKQNALRLQVPLPLAASVRRCAAPPPPRPARPGTGPGCR